MRDTALRHAGFFCFLKFLGSKANGYLINQFLDSKTNLRTDNDGGSLENKYRFLKEVMAAVMEIWPADRVGVRLSPNGVFNDMGSPDYRETFL